MSVRKFCSDCKWVDGGGRSPVSKYTLCLSPRRKIDLVTGEPERTFCDLNRLFYFGGCSSRGRWFEPRDAATVIETRPWWRFWR